MKVYCELLQGPEAGTEPGQGGVYLASQQEEAGAAELPVHLQEPLGGGTGAGFVLRAQPVPQGLYLPQQRLQEGMGGNS